MTFVFLFLPIVCAIYLLAKPRFQNAILLVASLLFYAWGEPTYLAVMLLTILVNWLGALAIDKWRGFKFPIALLTVAIDLGFLVYFKYFNFIVENINALCGTRIDFLRVVMPIGISFYTFQALSYLVDVYRDEVKVQKNFYKMALYISFFPQLVAGPIVKYHDIAELIDNRVATFNKVAYGVKRFIIGLAKKMLIANTMGALADKIFNQPVVQFDCLTAWIGAFAYSMQLFYDFSGYSDMAIGLGSIFGFKFLENFNYPYISKSITEFWRRWHISLSSWFREYLYIPLGGNRVPKWRNLINLFLVFLLTGIWHGASWVFVVWGLWHGFFIILEKLTGWNKEKQSVVFRIFQHIYTIFVFVVGWVFFRSETLGYAVDYLRNMFGLVAEHQIAYALPYYVNRIDIIAFVVASLCVTPLFKDILTIARERKILCAIVNVWLLLLFVFSAATIAASTYNPFIYFRF